MTSSHNSKKKKMSRATWLRRLSRVARRGSERRRASYAKTKKGTRHRTRTKVRTASRLRNRTKLDQGVKQLAHNMSLSKYFHGSRKTNLLGRVLKEFSHSNFNRTVPVVMNGSVGRQVVADFVGIDEYDISQIKGIVDSKSVPAITSGQLRTQRIMLREFRYELDIKNLSTDMVRVDIYDVICRRDIGFDNTNPTTYRNTPTRCFLEGFVDQINSGALTDYTVVGQSPFDSKQFTSFYQVKKVTHATVDPGGIHTHRVSGKPNFMYNDTLKEGTSGKVVSWKGLTVYTMIVAWGAPAVDSTGVNVTTENAQLGIIQNKRVEYSWAYSNINFSSYTNELGNALATINNTINPDVAELATYDTAI